MGGYSKNHQAGLALFMAVIRFFSCLLATTVAVLSLGGCSLFNPRVTVAPQVVMSEANAASLSGPITVSIYDGRLEASSGGQSVVLMDGQPLTIANDLTASIKGAVERALQRAGMRPVHRGEGPQLQIYLDQLLLTKPEGAEPNSTSTEAKIRIVLQTSTATWRQSYSAHKTGSTDDPQLVSEVLGQAINKAFADSQLIQQLRKL